MYLLELGDCLIARIKPNLPRELHSTESEEERRVRRLYGPLARDVGEASGSYTQVCH